MQYRDACMVFLWIASPVCFLSHFLPSISFPSLSFPVFIIIIVVSCVSLLSRISLFLFILIFLFSFSISLSSVHVLHSPFYFPFTSSFVYKRSLTSFSLYSLSSFHLLPSFIYSYLFTFALPSFPSPSLSFTFSSHFSLQPLYFPPFHSCLLVFFFTVSSFLIPVI